MVDETPFNPLDGTLGARAEKDRLSVANAIEQLKISEFFFKAAEGHWPPNADTVSKANAVYIAQAGEAVANIRDLQKKLSPADALIDLDAKISGTDVSLKLIHSIRNQSAAHPERGGMEEDPRLIKARESIHAYVLQLQENPALNPAQRVALTQIDENLGAIVSSSETVPPSRYEEINRRAAQIHLMAAGGELTLVLHGHGSDILNQDASKPHERIVYLRNKLVHEYETVANIRPTDAEFAAWNTALGTHAAELTQKHYTQSVLGRHHDNPVLQEMVARQFDRPSKSAQIEEYIRVFTLNDIMQRVDAGLEPGQAYELSELARLKDKPVLPTATIETSPEVVAHLSRLQELVGPHYVAMNTMVQANFDSRWLLRDDPNRMLKRGEDLQRIIETHREKQTPEAILAQQEADEKAAVKKSQEEISKAKGKVIGGVVGTYGKEIVPLLNATLGTMDVTLADMEHLQTELPLVMKHLAEGKQAPAMRLVTSQLLDNMAEHAQSLPNIPEKLKDTLAHHATQPVRAVSADVMSSPADSVQSGAVDHAEAMFAQKRFEDPDFINGPYSTEYVMERLRTQHQIAWDAPNISRTQVYLVGDHLEFDVNGTDEKRPKRPPHEGTYVTDIYPDNKPSNSEMVIRINLNKLREENPWEAAFVKGCKEAEATHIQFEAGKTQTYHIALDPQTGEVAYTMSRMESSQWHPIGTATFSPDHPPVIAPDKEALAKGRFQGEVPESLFSESLRPQLEALQQNPEYRAAYAQYEHLYEQRTEHSVSTLAQRLQQYPTSLQTILLHSGLQFEDLMGSTRPITRHNALTGKDFQDEVRGYYEPTDNVSVYSETLDNPDRRFWIADHENGHALSRIVATQLEGQGLLSQSPDWNQAVNAYREQNGQTHHPENAGKQSVVSQSTLDISYRTENHNEEYIAETTRRYVEAFAELHGDMDKVNAKLTKELGPMWVQYRDDILPKYDQVAQKFQPTTAMPEPQRANEHPHPRDGSAAPASVQAAPAAASQESSSGEHPQASNAKPGFGARVEQGVGHANRVMGVSSAVQSFQHFDQTGDTSELIVGATGMATTGLEAAESFAATGRFAKLGKIARLPGVQYIGDAVNIGLAIRSGDEGRIGSATIGAGGGAIGGVVGGMVGGPIGAAVGAVVVGTAANDFGQPIGMLFGDEKEKKLGQEGLDLTLTEYGRGYFGSTGGVPRLAGSLTKGTGQIVSGLGQATKWLGDKGEELTHKATDKIREKTAHGNVVVRAMGEGTARIVEATAGMVTKPAQLLGEGLDIAGKYVEEGGSWLKGMADKIDTAVHGKDAAWLEMDKKKAAHQQKVEALAKGQSAAPQAPATPAIDPMKKLAFGHGEFGGAGAGASVETTVQMANAATIHRQYDAMIKQFEAGRDGKLTADELKHMTAAERARYQGELHKLHLDDPKIDTATLAKIAPDLAPILASLDKAMQGQGGSTYAKQQSAQQKTH